MKLNKKLRVGIAGLGGIAKRTHLPVLELLPEYKIVCGAEKDEYQRKRVSELFNFQESYDDFNEMIQHADIDAVFICLPATLHAKAVKVALENGLHVFCEKPVGINSDEAKAMTSLAKKVNRILMPGYNLRHVDNFLRAKKLIQTGKLGKIIQVNAVFMNPGPYISWDPKSDWYLDGKSRGALYDIGSHIVDLLFYLYPHCIKHLRAFASKGYQPYDAITNVTCSYEGEDGQLGAIQVGWRSASEVCSLEFHGTAGTLLVSRRNFHYMHGATDPADRILNSIGNAYQEIGTVVRKLNMIRKGTDVLEEFKRQAIVFRKMIATMGKTSEKADEVVYVHHILESIYTSVINGENIVL